MKLAVTYENGQVFQHFGHTEAFKIYEIQEGKIVSEEVIGTDGQGHGALAGFLKVQSVEALICGGIGGGARAALAEAGIRLYPGVSGDADEAVKAFWKGSWSLIRMRSVRITDMDIHMTAPAMDQATRAAVIIVLNQK